MEELERTTSAREMQDWVAFYSFEPWGAERDNIHAGIVAATVFNMNRAPSVKPRSFTDFLLREHDPVAEGLAETRKFVVALRALAKPKRK